VKAELTAQTKAGITTIELDKIAGREIIKHKSTPSFLNYNGFPANICISVNEELIHGIPSNYKIKNGDMITFDVGVTFEDHICDSAFTVIVGENEEAQKISDATYKSLMESINIIKPGVYTGDIGYKTEEIAKSSGYEVIKDFGGHGCGNKLHEDPSVLNYGNNGEGTKLKPGMTLCIEPMLMTGSDEYITLDNK
jgi:methionyl aminopeptidase